MAKITKTLTVEVSASIAFQKFVHELNEWWPKEYTWSQRKLKEIRIDGRENGLCTEIGPHGFRCDWGRVTRLIDNSRIELKWQINPKREPVPDPDKASDITVDFLPDGDTTKIIFEHYNFENHGHGSEDYRTMMDSEHGWDYILNNYKRYCDLSD